MSLRVDFHTQVQDKILYACRLSRKVRAAQHQIVLLIQDQAQGQMLDEALWSFSATDFLPHVFANDDLAPQTPIILTQSLALDLPHKEILINLSQNTPAQAQDFQRVIEIISMEENDAQLGRERYRQYQRQGHTVTHTNVGAS